MNKQFLLLLDGMTGAGKTTTTKFLAQKMPRTAIIGMDSVKRFVSDFERGERDNSIARSVVFEMAKTYLQLGISVIVDQPIKNTEELTRYENLAKEHSTDIYKFQLFSSPEIAFSRAVNRQKDRPTERKVPEDIIQRNISLFKNKEELGFTVINTSSLKEDEASKIILDTIK